MLCKARDETKRVAGVVGGETGGGSVSRTGDETTMGFAILASVSTGLTSETTGVFPPWSVATSDGEVGVFFLVFWKL